MSRREDQSTVGVYRCTCTPLGVSVYMGKTTSRSSKYIKRERESKPLTISEIVTGLGCTCTPVHPYLGQTPTVCGGNTPPSEVPRNDDTNQRKGPNQ